MTAVEIMKRVVEVPEGESVVRVYRAIEGDIRVITEDSRGFEYRYTLKVNLRGFFELFPMDWR